MEHAVSISVRVVVGLILGYAVAFLGMITGSLMIPPINEADVIPLLARVAFISVGATIGASGAWFNLLIDRRKTALLLAAALVGAFTAGVISYYWSDAFTGQVDRYIRIREITQSTVIGAAIGANLIVAALAFLLPRAWRS